MTATQLEPNPVQAPTTGRTLHAFPPGANVSLCGRRLSTHPIPTSMDTRHCPVCLQAAADPAIR